MEKELLFPLSVVPGIGLLIMSTVQLNVNLSQEINMMMSEAERLKPIIELKIKQLKLLSSALISLYFSTILYVFSALTRMFPQIDQAFYFLVIGGTMNLLLALILLGYFALRALKIKAQYANMELNYCLSKHKHKI